jgi:hypothetical protein
VSTNGGSTFTLLTPRQPLTATPFAITAVNATGPVNGSSILSGTITGTQISSNSITALQLAPGAAAANLQSSGQIGVPSGGVILSASANATDLQSAGYSKLTEVHTSDLWTYRNSTNGELYFTWKAPSVWTGKEMIFWGGDIAGGSASYINQGGLYNITTYSATLLPTNGALSARGGHTIVWTGNEALVWGGVNNSGTPSYSYTFFKDGARYHLASNAWSSISLSNAPTERSYHSAVWTGTEMIVWGGTCYYGGAWINLKDGGRYNPVSDTWTPINTNGAPSGRYFHSAVWTGTEMIVWGGQIVGSNLGNGGRYNPTTDTWTTVNTNGAPCINSWHSAVWAGSEMIIWKSAGCYGRYIPTNDTWRGLGNGVPQLAGSASETHSVLWTGTEMMLWLGTTGGGARYNLASDAWQTISPVGAPAYNGKAIWTGSEMIIWDGANSYSYSPSKTLYLYMKP